MNKKQTDSLEIFKSAPIGQAVLKNTIPAMVAMMMVLIYNLADTFFIGQTKDALMIAAVSLVTPAFLLFMAVGTVFGIGGTSVISRAMGEGRREYAKKVCSFCMWSCVIAGIVMVIIIFALMDPILKMLGASADTMEYARQYLSIVTVAGPFVLISNCYANIIRTEGKAGMAMIGQLGGNLLNVILDPILILGFGWNVAGAAIATAVSNLVSAAYYIGYFKFGKSMLSISPKDFSVKDHILKGVLAIGIPAALGDVLMSVSSIVLNSQMAKYGDMAVAGVGVFLSDPEAFQYGVEFSRILLTTSFLFGMFYVLSNALQAMGAATSALIINMSRQGLIYIPVIFLLQSIIGMDGLLWVQPVADILSVVLVIILYRVTLKKKIHTQEPKTA